MTDDEIFKEYHLEPPEQAKFKIAEQKIKERGFSPDFTMPDEHFKYLVKQIYKTIRKCDNNIDWKIVILTMPGDKFNASVVFLSEKCILLIFDSRAMTLFGDIAKLIEKLAPKYEGEIAPNPENFRKEDFKKKISSLINEDEDKDIYCEFKKAILAFNRSTADSIDDEEEPDEIAKLIRDACMLFLLGHEFAHIWKKHRKIKDDEKDAIKKRWKQELEADDIGYNLMLKTMERLYPKIKYKGQFDLGFEIFLQCLAIDAPLWLIKNNKYEYSETHPDPSSRLGILRRISTKPVYDDDVQKEITHNFNMFISNEIFDTVTNKIISEILCKAAMFDKEEPMKKLSIDKIYENIYNTEYSYCNSNINGMNEWEAEYYTLAVRKFKNEEHSRLFYKIFAVFYDYILERSYSRMYSCVGQGHCFRTGIKYLKQKEYFEAWTCFGEAFNNNPDDIIIKLAFGLACSEIGQRFLKRKKYETAEKYFETAINCPLASRESFEGRMKALKKQKKDINASDDGKIYKILSCVPPQAERVREFMEYYESIFIKAYL